MLNNVDTNYNFKQIFLVFLFNIRKYSPKVMNIILPRLNNFDIKQKRRGMLVLLYATNTKKDLANQTQQILVKAQVFFVKTELQHI